MSVSPLVFDLPVSEPVILRAVHSRPHHPTQRTFDIVISFLMLIVLLPALMVLALAVRLSGPGGVLFRQTRIGRDGVPFVMLKFRTMHAHGHLRRDELRSLDEGNGVLFKIRRDPRVTRVGRVLRRLSLDELPQLVNVFRGDMALVGPRPALPEEVAAYTPFERHRLVTRPGLTGLWQVSGRSDLSWVDSVQLDLHYVRHASLRLDLQILLRTVGAVFTGRGAY